jgi:AraC-like DNA-binding protein
VTTEHDGHDASVQVNLTPTGARTLLGLPLSEIAGTVVELSDLLPGTRGLSGRLASTASWAERFRLVENVLLKRLLVGANVRSDVAWAVKQIDASRGSTKIGDLASALHISRKHLNALFRDHVGMPPKLYASLVRFDRLNLRILASEHRTWADLALDSGFADQAHMVREVRRFSGMSPTALRAYIAEMASLCGEDVLAQVDEPDIVPSAPPARTDLGDLVGLAR